MGSGVATLAGSWRWGLRITPILACMALAVGIISLRDPPRGNISNNNKIRMSYMKLNEICCLKNSLLKIVYLRSN